MRGSFLLLLLALSIAQNLMLSIIESTDEQNQTKMKSRTNNSAEPETGNTNRFNIEGGTVNFRGGWFSGGGDGAGGCDGEGGCD
jgi:hypothetical protein